MVCLNVKIGFWHFPDSYVRGNWRNTMTSSFSLLTKSCHDVDLILMLMGRRKCVKVSSFGSLKHFRKENKDRGQLKEEKEEKEDRGRDSWKGYLRNVEGLCSDNSPLPL